ncbi:PREDICTED: putative clathrin assembly protein At2g25430 [Lupinus angustifolius]|uniref:putative clathrin assembly protein At2g25430 n=1 Tax=Lupinus angustifolius TaxID=3871 RepID=UPI00092FA7C9|nr:PREDICTED: putative clathrin assembly protein At2g25430 [Lupinus angustifolius]
MAPITIRNAIGAVKDHTSIGLAKVASNVAPGLEVAVVKATSHHDDLASEKYVREILNLMSYSRSYVHACVSAVSKRLAKTRDWIVALKALMLVHRLMNEGPVLFQEEILYARRRGTKLLNMSNFMDQAHSTSWDYSAFVRTYAMYLDQRLELMLFDRKIGSGSGSGGSAADDRFWGRDHFRSPRAFEYEDGGEFRGGNGGHENGKRRTRSFGDMNETMTNEENRFVSVTPLGDMKLERIFGKMGHLQRLLDRFLASRPTGLARNSRMVVIALYPVVKESFQLYADICQVLALLLDKFFDMEYQDCIKTYDVYTRSAKQIDELIAFFNWCKETGVARSSQYPEVQRISGKLLETLEDFIRDRAKKLKNPERKELETPPVVNEEEEPVPDMIEIKALAPPENYTPPPPPEPEPEPKLQFTEDLVNLTYDADTADDQGNKLALALFAGGAANNGNGLWEAFPSDGQKEVASAWQAPAAEPGKADWELALVETASKLSNQKATLGGGMVRQHVSTAQLSGGSASSVALRGPEATTTPVLALPAPDGTAQAVNQDPFAASLSIPPPSYVQISDMEKKQQLLGQEQQLWQHYARDGMQGQSSLTILGGTGTYAGGPIPVMPYGMPPVNGIGPPTGYYHTPY